MKVQVWFPKSTYIVILDKEKVEITEKEHD